MRDWDGHDWGAARQEEKLRNMIEASAHDIDYWEALNLIAARLHREGQRLPDALAKWAAESHEGSRAAPRRRQSNKGEPHYTHDNRNDAFGYAFAVLRYLGLGKMDCYRAIADVRGVTEETVRNALKAHARSGGKLPAPWECWPSKH